MPEFRIGDYNYAFDSTVGCVATSEDAEFPVSNLAKYFLSKVWRTDPAGGTFVIDSTNNKIDFKDASGGGELTGTIASGTYTATTLAAAIDAALEAAGGADYTVSYSAVTGKWTITSNGSFLSILWLTGTNTATSVGSTIGFDVTADSTGALTYTGASIAIHTSERVTFDLRTTESIDSFALIVDKMAGWKFSADAVLKLQAGPTQVWTAPPVDVTLAFDETYSVLTHFFSSAQAYRYWSVKIVDPKNPNLYVELPKVFLTLATQLNQMPEIGFAVTSLDRSVHVATQYGHRYSDVYPSLRVARYRYAHLTEADIATLEAVWERVGSVAPVFLALDPTATLYDKDRFFIYGQLADEFAHEQSFYNYHNVGLSIVEAQ